MGQRTMSFLARYPVPPEILWGVVTDHEGMSRWMGVPVRVLSGPPEGGVGTVRRIAAGPLSVDEEVVVSEAPRRMVYRICRGLPVRYHRAEVRVDPWGEGQSQLTWEVIFASSVPGLADLLVSVLRPRINQGLRRLGDLLDED